MTIAANLAAAVKTEIEALVEDLLDNDETTAPWQLLDAIAQELGCATYVVIDEARRQGLSIGERGVARHVRTISSNSHDRWTGPGSCATHGGSGADQIQGFAGDRG